MPDDVIKGERGALSQMVDAHRDLGGHMVATMDVPRADLAPSTKAVIGRYILDGAIFDRLDTLRPGAGGELQLTDAINADIETIGVHGYILDGQRFDCGSVQGYVQATAAYALDRADLCDDYGAFFCEHIKPLRVAA